MKDLSLTYAEAAHGLHTAIAFEQTQEWEAWRDGERTSSFYGEQQKHLRIGLDCRASDHAALVDLLIAKGLFTREEYLEAMRLRINDELAEREKYIKDKFGMLDLSFR